MRGKSHILQRPDTDVLQDASTAQAIGALNTVGVAAFLCDATGKVRAMTPCAQGLLGEERALKLVGGRLLAGAETPDLGAVIRQQAISQDGGTTLLIPSGQGPALVLDITPLIREDWAARLPVRVLVTSRGRPGLTRPEPVLQASFGLTLAEAEVAIALVRGEKPPAIAAQRKVTVQTVRTQIRNLYSKIGVGHRAALAARLAALVSG